jgi:hypothetical protein
MGKTASELIDVADQHGYAITRDQLERWHKQGLLPRPKRVYLVGVRGSVSYYPEGTETQLLRLCEMHQERRKLAEIRMNLWWEGYSVDLACIRRDFVRNLTRFARALKQAMTPDRDALDLTEQAVPQVISKHRHPLERAVRRHLNGNVENTSTVLKTLLMLALDSNTPDWFADTEQSDLADEQKLERYVLRGLGLDGVVSGIDHEDAKRLGQLMRDVFLRPKSVVTNATDDDLSRARDNARDLINGLTAFSSILAATGADRALHLEGFRAFRAETLQQRVFFVTALMAMQKSVPQAGLDTVLTALRDHVSTFHTLQRLMSEQPNLRALIRRTTIQSIKAVQPKGLLPG